MNRDYEAELCALKTATQSLLEDARFLAMSLDRVNASASAEWLDDATLNLDGAVGMIECAIDAFKDNREN